MRFKLRAPTDQIYRWLLAEALVGVRIYTQNPRRRLVSTEALSAETEQLVKESGTVVTPEIQYESEQFV